MTRAERLVKAKARRHRAWEDMAASQTDDEWADAERAYKAACNAVRRIEAEEEPDAKTGTGTR